MLNRKYGRPRRRDGLINEVVAAAELRTRVARSATSWPTAGPRPSRRSSRRPREALGRFGSFARRAGPAHANYYRSEESKELGRAFGARQKPDARSSTDDAGVLGARPFYLLVTLTLVNTITGGRQVVPSCAVDQGRVTSPTPSSASSEGSRSRSSTPLPRRVRFPCDRSSRRR